MDDAPPDVADSLLSERQVAVLERRIGGESYETIADALDTTPEGVRTLETNARRQVEAAYRTVEVAESLRSDVRVEAEAGMRLLDVVRLLRSAGDRIGVKLETTEETLHETLRALLGARLDGNSLTEDVTLVIDGDGTVDVATPTDG
jgi:Tfx family DNA-binding protein